jgi:hypothetical protein
MYFAWRNLGEIDGSWLDSRSILGHADELAVFVTLQCGRLVGKGLTAV